MPFPWKKAKGKRFSQLVSNHLQPPKRGSSLILETGFPASLADLFVKNRDRFNNYTNINTINCNKINDNVVVVDKKKIKKKKRTSPPAPPIMIPTPDPEPLQNPSIMSTPLRILSVPLIASPRPCGDFVVGGDEIGVVCDRKDCEELSGKHVFVAVLKMFFVVMMALGAKRFSVGIAISAFLLLFLEYVGGLLVTSALLKWVFSCVVGLLKRHEKLLVMLSGCYAAGSVEAPAQEIGLGSDFDARVKKIRSGTDLDSSMSSLGYSRNKLKDLVSEIDVVQPSSNLVPPIREIPSVKYEINLRNGKEKWAEKAEEEVIEKMKQEQCIYPSKLILPDSSKEKSTCRSKIRSKIKKLANKLNGSKSKHKKKKANESTCDTFGTGNVIVVNQGDGEREAEVESDDESISTSSPSSGVISYDDGVNIEESICPEVSSSKNKDSIEKVERERSSLSGGYFVILVIVLAGLMGGRVLALVFALSWFLILKFGGTRLRRATN